MCVCLAQGGEGDEWMRGLGLDFTNPVGTGACWMCVCFGCGGARVFGPRGGVVLCLYIVLGGYLRILVFNPVAPHGYLLPHGPGFISTSASFMRSSASHPMGPHGRSAQNTAREGSTQFAQQFLTAVTAPPLVGGVV